MNLESAKLRDKNNRNFQLLLLAALCLIIEILPAAFDFSSKIPEPRDLQTASIKVTAAQSTLLNIIGQIASGATASFSFAQSTMLLPIGKVLYARIPSQSIDLLQGCSGSIAFDTTNNLCYPKK